MVFFFVEYLLCNIFCGIVIWQQLLQLAACEMSASFNCMYMQYGEVFSGEQHRSAAAVGPATIAAL